VIRGGGSSTRQRKIRPASLDELAALVEAMPERLRLAVHLGAWLSLRYGEIVELRRSDIDLKNGVVHVRRGVTWVGGKPVVGPPKSAAGVRDVAVPPHCCQSSRNTWSGTARGDVRSAVHEHTRWAPPPDDVLRGVVAGP
jgi:integrase